MTQGSETTGFSIGQVERMTGVKAYILRYWEEQIPLIRPRKDSLGKRFYSTRDVSILFRLKHLIYEKKFTAKGAGEQLLRELAGISSIPAVSSIQEIRSELMRLYGIVSSVSGDIVGEPSTPGELAEDLGGTDEIQR